MQNVQPGCFLWTAIISTTFMLAAPAMAGESKFVFVPRADSPGNDYFRVDNSSLEECERRCDQQSACNAFTYNQLHGVCFLKRAASRVTKFYALAITGIKLSPSGASTNAGENQLADSAYTESYFLIIPQADSPGNDYSRIDDSSYEKCRNSCGADNECNAFTYNHAHSVCFLKRAANQRPTFYAWAITGIKQTEPRVERAQTAQPPAAPAPVEPQVEQTQAQPPAPVVPQVEQKSPPAPVEPKVEQTEAQPPAAPVEPVTQSQAVGEDVTVLIAEYSGTGMQTTRPFTVDGPWEVQWSSDEFIQIFLSKADKEEHFPNIIANQIESGSGSSYQPQGGSYYLKISAMGKWHIKVVTIKNPETGRGGSGGHTLDEKMPGTEPWVATPSEQVEAPQPPIPPAPPQVATPEANKNAALPPVEAPTHGDTITAAEIAAGVSADKTELEQERWWDEHMGGKTHRISGEVYDVEKGSFSGYWVKLDIGRGMHVLCGFEDEAEAAVKSLRKGDRFTCKGKVAGSWTSLMGIMFSMEGGT
jgi:PAN domain